MMPECRAAELKIVKVARLPAPWTTFLTSKLDTHDARNKTATETAYP